LSRISSGKAQQEGKKERGSTKRSRFLIVVGNKCLISEDSSSLSSMASWASTKLSSELGLWKSGVEPSSNEIGIEVHQENSWKMIKNDNQLYSKLYHSILMMLSYNI
jgi:hypothetical protein